MDARISFGLHDDFTEAELQKSLEEQANLEIYLATTEGEGNDAKTAAAKEKLTNQMGAVARQLEDVSSEMDYIKLRHMLNWKVAETNDNYMIMTAVVQSLTYVVILWLQYMTIQYLVDRSNLRTWV
jgi:hypothetical protein